jgi:uncharacterized protein YdaU (DUF1376 family)
MHYYQFNIGDYKSHTEHLSEMEDLTYRRLLDWYYLHESPIPLDESEVARQIRMRSHSDCIAVVLREYFELTDDGWIHHRANKELAKAGEKSSKASQSAKARWDKKSNKNKDLAVDANALRTQSEGNATHNTEHITQDTVKKKKATIVACPPDVGEQVWQDWLSLRKAKKAAVTATVLDGARKEADKLGWPLEKFLVEWCTRGSQGLKAEWVAPKPSFAQQAADIARTTVPAQHAGRDPVLIKIEQERLRAVPPTVEQLEKMAALRRSIAK